MTAALVRARIPYALISAAALGAPGGASRLDGYQAVVLPGVAALSDQACATLDRYVRTGGGVVATGETSLYDPRGRRRLDLGLGDALGATLEAGTPPAGAAAARPAYLRFTHAPGERPPPLRAGPAAAFGADWQQTALLPFTGHLLRTGPRPGPSGAGATVALTHVPAFPTHPPEFAYPTQEGVGPPALYLVPSSRAGGLGGRVAYLPAEVDHAYWQRRRPDHAALLAALVRWVAGGSAPVEVCGPGLVDVHAYVQGGDQPPAGSGRAERADRVIVHLVNCTNVGAWRGPVEEIQPVGPQTVRIRVGRAHAAGTASLLVSGREVRVCPSTGTVELTIPTIHDHEVLTVELTRPAQ
jgi:hypothetical protein